MLAASVPPGKHVVLYHDHLAGVGSAHAGTTATSHVAKPKTRPPRIATRALPSGIAGLSYLAVLRAAGGTAPYAWSAAGLPGGLRLSPGGVITGYPLARGTRTVTVRARDARDAVSVARLRLAVPASLPGRCAARSCALLTPRPRTVTVPASRSSSVARSPGTGAGHPGSNCAAARASARATCWRCPPRAAIPSGLIAVATSVLGVGLVTPRGRLTAVAVRPATPADAFASGTVQALGAAAPGTGRWLTWPRIKQARAMRLRRHAGP